MTIEKALEDYCQQAIDSGATNALVTQPNRIVTAPWVQLKCQFGCPRYGYFYTCPPHTPTSEYTRKILDSYNRVLLFQLQWTKGEQSGREISKYMDNVVSMEIEMFLDGFYRAFSMLCGPCILCRHKESGCGILHEEPCRFPGKARPSMEGCGIDVFQTAHNHGFPLKTTRTEEEPRNLYSIILVD